MAEAAGNKKKSKKKRNKADENTSNVNSTNDRIVTLKNPMFFNNQANNNPEPINSMMRNLQTPPFVLPAGDQNAASIVRNENGMYTIRNPSFQSAFGGNPNSSFGMKVNDNSQFYEPQNDNLPSTKCSSVIGSEMKQRKKEQEYASMDSYYGQQQQQHNSMQQPRIHQPSSYHQFGNSSCYDHRNTMECENYDSGTYPIINLEDLRSGQNLQLNSEVSPHIFSKKLVFFYYYRDSSV